MRRTALGLALAALTLPVLAACGSSGTGAGGIPENSPTAASSADSSDTASAPASSNSETKCIKKGVKVPTSTTKFGDTPDISKPSGEPPCDLVVKDIKVGSGEAVTDTAKQYNWNYEGVAWSTGEKFDSSFDRGAPTPFALNQVIPGWTEGLQGMKPGGRRMLIIPSEKAYGETGNQGIGPNETLVFVVDLVGAPDA